MYLSKRPGLRSSSTLEIQLTCPATREKARSIRIAPTAPKTLNTSGKCITHNTSAPSTNTGTHCLSTKIPSSTKADHHVHQRGPNGFKLETALRNRRYVFAAQYRLAEERCHPRWTSIRGKRIAVLKPRTEPKRLPRYRVPEPRRPFKPRRRPVSRRTTITPTNQHHA